MSLNTHDKDLQEALLKLGANSPDKMIRLKARILALVIIALSGWSLAVWLIVREVAR